MKPGLTHRMRGHQMKRVRRHVDTGTTYGHGYGVLIESGRIDDRIVCSCGESWLHVPEALTNRWHWV